MFVWSSSASPVSEGNLRHAESAASKAMNQLIENMNPAGKMSGEKENDVEDGCKFPQNVSPFTCQKKMEMAADGASKKHQMPPASVMTRLILIMGLGMAMFSLGLFMALQPKIIACGKSVATFAMAVRFLTGPAVIAATSIAIGIRGVLLHVAIVQAALPQGIVPFVFAKEYNVHPDILSTAVIFGMLIALPITVLYYVLLGV
ncbi:hypothetical protein OIU84_001006 [Salix udensis]|uniref:Auxin efflux carrier component n=1 Tax=Salix udensis TaxID=889485 RepID=A0AAD6PN19_9ROSI|nr:hypothetical protein OIU84_001006 [Salix udensis]